MADEGDSTTMTIVLVAMGVMVILLFCSIIACATLCKPDQFDYYDAIELIDGRDLLLLRENLADTTLPDGQSEWQCIVCLHFNHPEHASCNLCGAAADLSIVQSHQNSTELSNNPSFILTDTILETNNPAPVVAMIGSTSFRSQRTQSGIPMLRSHGSSLPLSRSSSSETAPLESNVLTASSRQRALRYRRLNQMQLTQRQRGATRRRLWQRVHLPNHHAFVWVRTQEPTRVPRKPDDSFLQKFRQNASLLIASSKHHTYTLRQTIAEQLHRKNAASVGFFTEFNDVGELSWRKTDEVALQVDDQVETALSDLQVDLEGLMSLSFREKKKWFLKTINQLAVPFTESLYKLHVRRDHLLEDSMAALTGNMDPMQAKEHLNISFVGEPALDAGGVLREWFSLVCHELFAAERRLFCTTHAENASYWIYPTASVNDEVLRFYTFAGRIFGKAILDGLVFETHFCLPLLKHLLGVPITFSDLEFLDQELYNSCRWMQEHEGVNALCVTFSVQALDGEIVDLKPHGREIDVTDDNKHEYLMLLLQYRMLDSVRPQLTAMLQGLYEIIPKAILSIFDYQELDFFLCGLPTLNVKDWRQHTRVRHVAIRELDPIAFEREGAVLNWFWEVLELEFSDEERARFLQFATGSSRVPVEGFKALTSASGYVHPFTIQLIVPSQPPPLGLCPRAHTCFNRVDLPIYAHKEDLVTYLTLVIQMEMTTGFGME